MPSTSPRAGERPIKFPCDPWPQTTPVRHWPMIRCPGHPLPRWIFGLDLGLENDIDIFQYRYFAHLAESRLSEGDNVVLMTHQPLWLAEWFHQRRQGSNLRQLVHGHLRGRVPVHMAGDLHFYMRHSLSQSSPTPTAATDSPGCSPEPKEPEKCGLNRQSSVHNLSSPIPKHVVSICDLLVHCAS